MKQHFICATKTYSTFEKPINAPYFRKEFQLFDFQNASVKICGLGFYELFINGQKITKGKLAPYISNPDQVCYYDEYDLTPYLRKGNNVIGTILGNGFQNNIGGWPWNMDKAEFRSAPKFSLVLSVDGKEFLHSDETFKTAPSPIYFDDLRYGEYYNANFEQDGWADINFDDSTWNFALKAPTPKGKIEFCSTDPVRVIQEIKPVHFFKSDNGYIFDFGINTAGVCKIEFEGLKGQKLSFWHGEALLENRVLYLKNTVVPYADINTAQKDILICSGKQDVFEPSFTYHGFRYVYVEGLGGSQIEQFKITLLRMSSDFATVGTFACSNDIVNKLQACTVNTDRSNFIYFPTDCPQREKNGWTGDAALSAEQMLYNFDCANSYCSWLDTVRNTQRPNGELPGIIPTVEWGYTWNGPAWDRVIIEIPYQCYRFTGDLSVLKNNANAIKKHLLYLETKINDNGLIAYGLPDWLECGARLEELASTPLEVSDSLISIESCNKAAKIFKILGDENGERQATALGDKLRSSFKRIWMDDNGWVTCRTQSAQALAIAYKIFSKEEEPLAIKNLITLIQDNGRRFKTGMLGTRVLFDTLANNGYADLALELITKDGFPSFKYWLDHGATSLWEGFNELYDNSILRKDGERVLSLNHPCWGHISAVFYRYILGINVNPNLTAPTFFELDPAILFNLDYAKGSYIRNGNGIKLSVKRKEGKIYMNVTTVGNAKYTLSERAKAYTIIENE